MMQITRKMKMANVIHLNYLLLPVINRFDISLGFGDSTIEEVCHKQNVNVDFFLDIVNAYHDESYFPENDLQTFSVKLIVKYLSRAHGNYLNNNVPEIESLINDLTNDCTQQKKNIELLKNFFNEYKNEITEHITREESAVYPYALKIEKVFEEKVISNDLIKQMSKYSITDYASEHDNIEEKLYDLKNIIIKYLPPTKNPDLCNKILTKLFTLEKDLKDHSRIEEKVMVPKIIKMEKEILSGFKAN